MNPRWNIRPADVELVDHGSDRVYVVTGVGRADEPSVVPARSMRIRPRRDRRNGRESWWLEIDGDLQSKHNTLREARYEASAVEFETRE